MNSYGVTRLPALVLILVVCQIAWLLFGSDAWANEDALELVTRATESYQEALNEKDRDRRLALFRTAETLFDQAISSREQQATSSISPDLYVNLGNAALGSDRLGHAILAYRRALAIDANHPRAIQNLEHARTLLPNWVPVPEQESITLGSFFDSVNNLSANSRWGVAALVFFVAAVFFAVYLKSDNRAWRWLSLLTGVLWCLSIWWAMMADSGENESIAVVIVPEVTARSADSNNAPTRFSDPLPSGTELLVAENRGEWIHVDFFDGREAWLPSWAIERVESDGQ